MRRILGSLWVGLAVLGLTGSARGDEPDRCATAAEAAQRARLAGKLREARAHLISCTRDACPQVVRSDCGRWLSEVESELPTIVVRARDASGQDVSDVRVYVDGEQVAASVTGMPLAVDVGERVVRFERAGSPAVTQRIITRSGEHSRIVTVEFEGEHGHAPSQVGPAVLAGAGLALAVAGGVLWGVGRGEHDDLESTCAPTGACATSDVDAARVKLIVGDVAVAIGSLAVAGAVTWWLVGRGGTNARGTRLPSVFTF